MRVVAEAALHLGGGLLGEGFCRSFPVPFQLSPRVLLQQRRCVSSIPYRGLALGRTIRSGVRQEVVQSNQTTVRTNEDWVAELTADGARQEAALAELRGRLRRGLYAFLRQHRSDMARRDSEDLGQMAEDFAQESLLKILDGLSSFRGESRFTTWAMKIAIRTAVSNLRRAAYRDLSLDDLAERGTSLRLLPDASVGPASLPDPQREAERNEVFTLLAQAVKTELSDRQRQAFLATNVDGVPVEIVAQLMGSNPNALYKLVHDARRKLRRSLIDQGFTFDRVAPLFESS